MFPGAAVIYLLGTDAIHDLRREMSVLKGTSFSLRDFHDEFLSFGSIPVSLIAEEMKARVSPQGEEQKRAETEGPANAE
jgi:uncharacterized protein (DUF885 family)